MEEVGQVPHHKLYIYHTKYSFFVAGYSKQRRQYALLRIARQDGPTLQAKEDPHTYTLQELNAVLQSTHAACAQQGGLQFVCKAYGLVGCIRFTASYYLLIITRRSYVGSICGHKVFAVSAVSLLPLGAAVGMSQQKDSATEKRYRKILMGVDLSKNFYFSLTYRLASTLQANHRMGVSRLHGSQGNLHDPSAPSPHPHPRVASPFASAPVSNDEFDSMFVWNSYLTRSLRTVLGNRLWLVALVHGYFDQKRVSVLGRPMTLTLIARRSRHFAGTRFKKRGLSDQGKVANEVEVEQILDVGVDPCSGLPLISSVVQVRGSVPLYWSQQPTPLSPKPDILLQSFDPMYEATALHFDDLRMRYGSPIVCLNLLKSSERRPRETLLRREMGIAIAMLNRRSPDRDQLVHVPWDLQKHAKGLLNEISSITHLTLEATGLFVHHPSTVQMATGLPVPSPAYLGLPLMLPDNTNTTTNYQPQPPHDTNGQELNMSNEPASVTNNHEHTTANHHQSTTPAVDVTSPLYVAAQRRAAKKLYMSHLYQHQPPADPDVFVPPWYCLYQQGVLRTNCIDCLDRTNVAQFAYGLVALGLQLYLLGVGESPEIDSDCSMALVLMEQYELMGNTLSMQYGGSDAHSMFFQRKKGQWEAGSRSKDLLTSIQRFYSNTYTDAEKQDAINLVLGNYIPGRPGQPELWELEHDVYLHNVSESASSLPHLAPAPARALSYAPPPPPPHTHQQPSRASSVTIQSLPSTTPGSPRPAEAAPAAAHSRRSSTAQQSAAGTTPQALPSSPFAAGDLPTPFASTIQAIRATSTSGHSRTTSATLTLVPPARSHTGGASVTTPLSPRPTAHHQPASPPGHTRIKTSVTLLSLSSDDDGLGAGEGGSFSAASGSDFEGLLAALGPELAAPGSSYAEYMSQETSAGSWSGWGSLWSSFFGGSQPRFVPNPGIPMPRETHDPLQGLDMVLGKPCRRSLPVRLHTALRGGGSDQPVWQAVQQAFSYFWTQQEGEDPDGPSTPPTPALTHTAQSKQHTQRTHQHGPQQQQRVSQPPRNGGGASGVGGGGGVGAGGTSKASAARTPTAADAESASVSDSRAHSRVVLTGRLREQALPAYLCSALLNYGGGGGGVGVAVSAMRRSRSGAGSWATAHASPFLAAAMRLRAARGAAAPAAPALAPRMSVSLSGALTPTRRNTAASLGSLRLAPPSATLPQAPPCAACVWSLSESRRTALVALMQIGRKLGHGLPTALSSSLTASQPPSPRVRASPEPSHSPALISRRPSHAGTNPSTPKPPTTTTNTNTNPHSALTRWFHAHAGCLPSCMDPTCDVLAWTTVSSHTLPVTTSLLLVGEKASHVGVAGAITLWAWHFNPAPLPIDTLFASTRVPQPAHPFPPPRVAAPGGGTSYSTPQPPASPHVSGNVRRTLTDKSPLLGNIGSISLKDMFSFKPSASSSGLALMAATGPMAPPVLWPKRGAQTPPPEPAPAPPPRPAATARSTTEAALGTSPVPGDLGGISFATMPGVLGVTADQGGVGGVGGSVMPGTIRVSPSAGSFVAVTGTSTPTKPDPTHNRQELGAPTQGHSTMAALGRAPVGMGPNSAAANVSGGGSKGPGTQNTSGLWGLVNPASLVTALTQMTGATKEPPKPPIPLLNDFISIGPQAEATLAARRAGVAPAAAAAGRGAAGAASHASHPYDGFGSQHQMILDDFVFVEAYYDSQERATRAPWEIELSATTGLRWSSELGGWLPAGSSMYTLLRQSVSGCGLTDRDMETWGTQHMCQGYVSCPGAGEAQGALAWAAWATSTLPTTTTPA